MTGDNKGIHSDILNSDKNSLIYIVIVIVFINIGVNIAQLYLKPNDAQF
jgi:hypothetical protein